jgi:hypothetical protein
MNFLMLHCQGNDIAGSRGQGALTLPSVGQGLCYAPTGGRGPAFVPRTLDFG